MHGLEIINELDWKETVEDRVGGVLWYRCR
jgi:hypothetical protein